MSERRLQPSLVHTKGTKYGKHDQPIIARLIPRLIIGDGCWGWLGHISDKGYGYLWHEGKWLKAHREVWKLLVGPIPEDQEPDHDCHNEAVRRGECEGGACSHRRCSNPAHLALRDHSGNMQSSPLTQAHKNKNKTRCVNGHEFTEETTRWRVDGNRACKVCEVEGERRRRQERRDNTGPTMSTREWLDSLGADQDIH